MKTSATMAWIGALTIVGTLGAGPASARSTGLALVGIKEAGLSGIVILRPRPLPPHVIPTPVPPPPPAAVPSGGSVTGTGTGKMAACDGDCGNEQSVSEQDGSLFMSYDLFAVVEGGIRLPPELE